MSVLVLWLFHTYFFLLFVILDCWHLSEINFIDGSMNGWIDWLINCSADVSWFKFYAVNASIVQHHRGSSYRRPQSLGWWQLWLHNGRATTAASALYQLLRRQTVLPFSLSFFIGYQSKRSLCAKTASRQNEVKTVLIVCLPMSLPPLTRSHLAISK